MKLFNNTHSDCGLSYKTVMNNQSFTICSGITQPHQFSLENIPAMSRITDSVGEGDDRKIKKKNQQKKQLCKWIRRGSHDHIKTF
jgi:hypothetical protein